MKLRHLVNKDKGFEAFLLECLEDQRILVMKVEQLRGLLSDMTTDEERTVFGSEPIYKSIVSGEERRVIQRKLMELINKF